MQRNLQSNINLRVFLRTLSVNSADSASKTDRKVVICKPYNEIPSQHPFLRVSKVAGLLFPGRITKSVLKYFENKLATRRPVYRDNSNANFESITLESPEDAESVLRNEAKYPVRIVNLQLSHFREEKKKPAGVFFADGKEWYKHRTVISKRMLRPKEIGSYAVALNSIVSEFIDHVRQVRQPAGAVNEFEMKDLGNSLFRWSFEGVGNFVFDRRFGALQEPMADPRAQKLIRSIQEFLDSILDTVRLPIDDYKLKEAPVCTRFEDGLSNLYFYVESFLDEALEEMQQTESHLNENERVNFWKYLLMSGKLEIDDLVASVVDLIFAGIDTTANTVHWSLYLLGKNPDKLEKLEDEIHSLLKPGESAYQQHLPFLKAVVKETLRLYPIINHLPRKIPQDMVLSGYHVPAGTQVFMNFIQMSRNPELFPNPEAFIPERWFGATTEQSKFASLPFGFGVRMCVGRRLAELEMHLLLARLVQEFKMEYPSGEEIAVKLRIVPSPDKSVRIKFYDR